MNASWRVGGCLGVCLVIFAIFSPQNSFAESNTATFATREHLLSRQKDIGIIRQLLELEGADTSRLNGNSGAHFETLGRAYQDYRGLGLGAKAPQDALQDLRIEPALELLATMANGEINFGDGLIGRRTDRGYQIFIERATPTGIETEHRSYTAAFEHFETTFVASKRRTVIQHRAGVGRDTASIPTPKAQNADLPDWPAADEAEVRGLARVKRFLLRRVFTPGNLRAGTMSFIDGVASVWGALFASIGLGIPLHQIAIAAVFGGVYSMSAGEFASVSVESAAVDHEKGRAVELEKAIRERTSNHPSFILAVQELRQIGLENDLSREEIDAILKDVVNGGSLKSHYHALGFDFRKNSPWSAAGISFVSFLLGSAAPILPVFLGINVLGSALIPITVASAAALALGGGILAVHHGLPWYSGVLRFVLASGFGVTMSLASGALTGLAVAL